MFNDWQKDIALIVALVLAFLEVTVGVIALLVHELPQGNAIELTRLRRVRRLFFLSLAGLAAGEIAVITMLSLVTEPNFVLSILLYAYSATICMMFLLVFMASRFSPIIALLYGSLCTITAIAHQQMRSFSKVNIFITLLEIHLQKLSMFLILVCVIMFAGITFKLFARIRKETQDLYFGEE